MLRLSSDINIGDYNFNFCNEVEINSSWENLTDTAKITIPKNIRFKKDGIFTDAITAGSDALWKRGDSVSLSLGYDDVNASIFSGVITKISPKFPMVFECQDNMYILKQTTIPKYSKTGVTLNQLIGDILPSNFTYETEDITLGKFIISSASVAEVLDYLKKKFGITSYFQNGVLYSGFAYKSATIDTIANGPLKTFDFNKNIIDASNLEYIRDDDTNLKVTAINILPNNTRQSITVGDSLGEQRTLYFYDVTTAELNTLANEALTKYKYEGFTGSFLTFLQPTVIHGEAIQLVDATIPDRNGVYLVKRVITRFGQGGGRQEIHLDRKI